jgi:aspartate aminotransferase
MIWVHQFPVPGPISDALAASASLGHYADAAGISEVREAIAGFYSRHFGIMTDPGRVIVGNGSKELLFLIFPWSAGPSSSPLHHGSVMHHSYGSSENHTTYYLPGRRTAIRSIRQTFDGLLRSLVAGQHILLLNNPHNPTGAVYSREELQAIADVCRSDGALVLADEIYALTTYDRESFVSMGTIFPDGTFVTGGLSKDRSAAGYRFGTCVLPSECSEKMVADFAKVAATLYTNITTRCCKLKLGSSSLGSPACASCCTTDRSSRVHVGND